MVMISKLARKSIGFALVLSAMAPMAHAITRVDVPEIDAGSAASALTLLVGGAMLLRDKLRSR